MGILRESREFNIQTCFHKHVKNFSIEIILIII